MCVTTVPSAAARHQLPCSSIRPIEPASIPSSISPDIAGSSRPTPMPGSMRCTSRIESRDRSRKPAAGRTPDASCSSLPTSPRRRATGNRPTISPIAFEAVQKFDAIFMLERSINGWSPAARLAARRKDIAPLVNDLIDWMKRERAKLSRHNEVAKAMDYMLKRIDVFTRFLDDGRICLSNNAAERELRGIALGRKAWLFAGSDRGGERAAVMLTLIQTAKLNDVDPQAWLADVLARIADHKITDLAALLPWNWRLASPSTAPPDRGCTGSRNHDQPSCRTPRRGRGAVVGHRHGHGAGGRSPLDLRHRRPADRRLHPDRMECLRELLAECTNATAHPPRS